MAAGGTRNGIGIRAVVAALVVAVVLMGAVGSSAAESTETTTFGADGIALASLGPNYLETRFSSLTPRADGSFVARRDDQLETFLPDGAPDPSAPPVAVPRGRDVFPVAGGKSLVLEEGKLTRVNPDGSPDTSFGGTGTVDLPTYHVDAAVELGSGRIAAIGAAIVGPRRPTGYVEVAVLNPDGTVVPSAVPQIPELPIHSEIELREIVPMTDGGALVVDESFLLELRADGTLDGTFGKKGFVFVNRLASARFRPDGSIEAVGQSYGPGTENDLALFRFTPAGQPEPSFGPEGVRRFDLGGNEVVNVASWTADDSVIAAGYEVSKRPCPHADCGTVPILAAVDSAGNLEAGFGEGGVLRLNALAGSRTSYMEHGALALARRPDGSILVAGTAPPEETVAFLAGVSTQGDLVPSFGEGGIVRVRSPVPAGQALAGISSLPDGGLLAAGTTELDVEETPVLIRYAADGSLDPGFGGGAGYVVLGPQGQWPTAFALQGEKALISLGGSLHNRLLMYGTAHGELVSNFGSSGSATLPKDMQVKALDFARDGDPLVLTRRRHGPYEVRRYLPDGSLDQSFGRGGKARLRLPGGGEVDASSLALGAHGTIVIAGRSEGRFALGRLRADGRPDQRFGSGGWSLVSGPLPAEYELATPSRDGSHIYLAGCTGNEERNRIVLMRFTRDGRLDRAFGRRGRLTTTYPREAAPTLIAPGRNGVLVGVDFGPRPLLTFSPSGKVRRRAPGPKLEFVRELRGTVSDGQLILGWSHPITESLTETSYISKRPFR